MPVSDTPNNLSSSVLRCHTLRRYGNFVKVAWIVPRIEAIRTFLRSVFSVSSYLTTASVRLQNW